MAQDPAEGDKVRYPAAQSGSQASKIYPPNIFEHVEHLWREMGGGHVKLCKVSFQHGGRGSFSDQRWHHLIMQYTAGQKERGQGNKAQTNRQLSRLLFGNVVHHLPLLQTWPCGGGCAHQGEGGLGHLRRRAGIQSPCSGWPESTRKKLFWPCTHFTHDLSPVEHDLVPFAEAVFRCLLSF